MIRQRYVRGVATGKRQDLAAMLSPILRELISVERPILEANGLSMWGYTVLLALDDGPVRTQAALAEMIGADKTRIIADLDDLESNAMITRSPDPDDRRVRLVSITAKGRRARDRAQEAIQKREETMLAQFGAADRRAFLRVTQTLAEPERGST